MIGLACLPYGDIDAAVQEVHRVAKMGLRGSSCRARGTWSRCGTRCWEPLWKAVNEVQLPLHFHTFPAMPPRLREQPGAGHAAPAHVHTASGVPDER